MAVELLALPFGIAIDLLLDLVGGGGSILAVPVLVYILGQPVHAATSESLFVGTAARVGAAAAVGALLGRRLTTRFNQRRLKTIFAATLTGLAIPLVLENTATLA